MQTAEIIGISVVAAVVTLGSLVLFLRCCKALLEVAQDRQKAKEKQTFARQLGNSLRKSFRGMRESLRRKKYDRNGLGVYDFVQESSLIHPAYLKKQEAPEPEDTSEDVLGLTTIQEVEEIEEDQNLRSYPSIPDIDAVSSSSGETLILDGTLTSQASFTKKECEYEEVGPSRFTKTDITDQEEKVEDLHKNLVLHPCGIDLNESRPQENDEKSSKKQKVNTDITQSNNKERRKTDSSTKSCEITQSNKTSRELGPDIVDSVNICNEKNKSQNDSDAAKSNNRSENRLKLSIRSLKSKSKKKSEGNTKDNPNKHTEVKVAAEYEDVQPTEAERRPGVQRRSASMYETSRLQYHPTHAGPLPPAGYQRRSASFDIPSTTSGHPPHWDQARYPLPNSNRSVTAYPTMPGGRGQLAPAWPPYPRLPAGRYLSQMPRSPRPPGSRHQNPYDLHGYYDLRHRPAPLPRQEIIVPADPVRPDSKQHIVTELHENTEHYSTGIGQNHARPTAQGQYTMTSNFYTGSQRPDNINIKIKNTYL